MINIETDLCVRRYPDKDILVLPPESARGCTQTLKLISTNTVLHRNVNGKLVNLKQNGYEKYTSTITCVDKSPFPCEGLWVGTELIVDCIQNLACSISQNQSSINLEREPVKNSVIFQRNDKMLQLCSPIHKVDPPRIEVLISDQDDSQHPGGILYYRPKLHMCVTNYRLKTDEWNCVCGWEITLEEI